MSSRVGKEKRRARVDERLKKEKLRKIGGINLRPEDFIKGKIMKFEDYRGVDVLDSEKQVWAEGLLKDICDDKKPNWFVHLSGNGAVLAYRDESRVVLYDCKASGRSEVEIGVVKPDLSESLRVLNASLADLQETVNEGED